MNNDNPTLPGILPPPLFLPPGPPHKSGDHTGAALAVEDPETYRLIGELYSQGIGMIKISEMLRISVNTVLAVVHREAAAAPVAGAEMDNQRSMSMMRHVRALAAEGAIEDLSDDQRRRKISARDKTLILAITTDKIELLSGNATVRIEHVDATRPAVEDFRDWLNKGVITNAPEMDLGTRKCGAKEPPSGPDAPTSSPTTPDASLVQPTPAPEGGGTATDGQEPEDAALGCL